MAKRAILIVLDSVGIGEMPDALEYGDQGSNTLGNIAKAMNGLNLPNLQALGLGNIAPIQGVEPADNPQACYGKMAEASQEKIRLRGIGKSQASFWKKRFRRFRKGFPRNLYKLLKRKSDAAF